MKKLAVVIAAAILVTGIVALHLWRELHGEREQYAGLQARVAELEAAQEAASVSQAAAAPAPLPASTVAASPAAASQTKIAGAAATVADRKPAGPSGNDLAAGMMDMMMSPENLRAMLEQEYPDLAKELNLSPAEAQKFLDLLAKQQADSLDDALGMFGGGDNAAMQASQRRLMEKEAANERELAAMLGSKYPQWEEYQGTIAAREQVTQLRAMLGSGDNALRETQIKPLVAALGAETARVNRDMRNKMKSATSGSQNMLEEQLGQMTEQNRRLATVASSQLTNPQLNTFKQMLEQQESMLRMMLGTMSGQGNARSQGGATR